jgi:hypothetical protein
VPHNSLNQTIPGEKRPLVVCDSYPIEQVESTHKKTQSVNSEESDEEQQEK